MNTLDRTLKNLTQTEEEMRQNYEVLKKRFVDAARRSFILCIHCNKKSVLSSWTFIQNHWYEKPHGCLGGDNWWSSKKECCHISCPKCEKQNYLYNHPQKEKIVKILNDFRFNEEELFLMVYDEHNDKYKSRKE